MAQQKVMSTKLQYDILVSIAEKIIFSPDNEFCLDFRDLEMLHFMFVNRTCQNSFFFQFRRMKKVYLSSGGLELRSPTPVEGRHPAPDQSSFFHGPFNVNDWLFLFLLQRDVLRPKSVEIFSALGNHAPAPVTRPPWACDQPDGNGDGCTPRSIADETPIESLMKLLLFKGSQELFEKFSSLKMERTELRLDVVKVTDTSGVFAHLDRILNLNSVEIYVESIGAFSDFSPIKIENVKANQVRHITLIYSVDINDPETDTRDFPYEHLRSVLNAIVAACGATLERVYVRFCLNGEFVDADFGVLSDWLQATIKTLSTETLVNFECQCEVTISFHAFFPEATLLEANESAHELTQMGEEKSSCSDDYDVATGDYFDDNLSCSLSAAGVGDDSPTLFTIARQLSVDPKRLKRISYSLVGVQVDNTQDEWNGFNGPVIFDDFADEWNGFVSDGDEHSEEDHQAAAVVAVAVQNQQNEPVEAVDEVVAVVP